MKTTKNTTAAEQTGTEINWTRKPCDTNEIGSTLIPDGINLSNLFTGDYILDNECQNIIPEKLTKIEFTCLCEDGHTYLIDPSGFDYPRYATRLVRKF